MVGTVVCIAASIAGDTSQDLKTGFVLGATPRRQQIGELIGVITSAGVVCLRDRCVLHRTAEGRSGRAGAAGAAGRPDEADHRRRAGSEAALDADPDRRRASALVAWALRCPCCRSPSASTCRCLHDGCGVLGGLLRWLLTRGTSSEEASRATARAGHAVRLGPRRRRRWSDRCPAGRCGSSPAWGERIKAFPLEPVRSRRRQHGLALVTEALALLVTILISAGDRGEAVWT